MNYVKMVETVIVHMVQVILGGQKVKPEAGSTYFSFHAIPYANSPVGPLRFKLSLVILVIKTTYRCSSALFCNCEQQMKPTENCQKNHDEFVYRTLNQKQPLFPK